MTNATIRRSNTGRITHSRKLNELLDIFQRPINMTDKTRIPRNDFSDGSSKLNRLMFIGEHGHRPRPLRRRCVDGNASLVARHTAWIE